MAWLGFVKIGFYEAVSLVDKAMEAGMELFSLFICFHCLVKCLPSPGLPWLPWFALPGCPGEECRCVRAVWAAGGLNESQLNPRPGPVTTLGQQRPALQPAGNIAGRKSETLSVLTPSLYSCIKATRYYVKLPIIEYSFLRKFSNGQPRETISFCRSPGSVLLSGQQCCGPAPPSRSAARPLLSISPASLERGSCPPR